jgi:hypothetical protein
MEVTDVKIKKVENGAILGFADIEFDGVFTSKGWRIWPGREGRKYDLGFPSEPDKQGRKNKDTGKLQYWYTSYIDLKGEGGQKLMEHIRQEVFLRYEKAPVDGGNQADDDVDW